MPDSFSTMPTKRDESKLRSAFSIAGSA